jgi:hypothetical protein
VPYALHSFQCEKDGSIQIQHTFFGATMAAALHSQKEHAGGCPHYGPAFSHGKTIDIVEEIEALPEGDEEDLLEFLDLDEELEEEEED